jgi:hypothetical protein
MKRYWAPQAIYERLITSLLYNIARYSATLFLQAKKETKYNWLTGVNSLSLLYLYDFPCIASLPPFGSYIVACWDQRATSCNARALLRKKASTCTPEKFAQNSEDLLSKKVHTCSTYMYSTHLTIVSYPLLVWYRLWLQQNRRDICDLRSSSAKCSIRSIKIFFLYFLIRSAQLEHFTVTNMFSLARKFWLDSMSFPNF